MRIFVSETKGAAFDSSVLGKLICALHAADFRTGSADLEQLNAELETAISVFQQELWTFRIWLQFNDIKIPTSDEQSSPNEDKRGKTGGPPKEKEIRICRGIITSFREKNPGADLPNKTSIADGLTKQVQISRTRALKAAELALGGFASSR